MPVVRLVEHEALQVWVGIPADLAKQLAAGSQVSVTIRGAEFVGTLLAKLPELDRTTRTRTVIVRLEEEAAANVLPGEVARVELEFPGSTDGIWLPHAALDRGLAGLWSVFVVVGESSAGSVERRSVELLALEDERVLVRGALADGDRVIANGTHRVVPGQRVRGNDLRGAAGPVASGRESAE
jgi:RND family efflux transporter MFP subunit